VAGTDVALTLIPLVVGLLAAFVAVGRWQLAPHSGASRRSLRQAVSARG
jgi:hypothetical protein